MPIFQDPDRQRFYDLWSDDHSHQEHHQERENESRNPLTSPWNFFGHVDCEFESSNPDVESSTGDPRAPGPHLSKLPPSDRGELIQYLKKADASTWVQTHLDDTHNHHTSNPDTSHDCPPHMEGSSNVERYTGSEQSANEAQELASPADIERPRSALHSGDFREGSVEHQDQGQLQSPLSGPGPSSHLLSSSPTTPWYDTPLFSSLRRQDAPAQSLDPRAQVATRSRAPSLGSFSSSYVLKAPTSPLVHQANNTDLDFSPKADSMEFSEAQEKANRRRTLPPETFRYLQPSFPPDHINFRAVHCPGRPEEAFPYQTSPTRRTSTSTSTYSLQLASSVRAPPLRTRSPSLNSDVSKKGHASMVGSYEESILRGRMSMNPSKPLDFTAQIGVLGKSKCKTGLKCPPHVTIPFPAVFYSYPTSGFGRSISDDNPSPYVGHIDLENSLPKDDYSGSSRRRRRHTSPVGFHDDSIAQDTAAPRYYDQEALRRREKKHRRAESPKCPPAGCYKIPQQGQLQVMIKNPNKTAVKLFLVPYDLSDMEPGTKTFIRQRSYSAGPVIDMPLSARKNYGTDRPEASLNVSADPKDKPILRYLIHLNICCPSKGRFYLHSSVRVVFANRVPDGKEALRNEIQHPDPKYTPYKPAREPNPASAGAKSATEKASRRRSTGLGTMPWLVSPNNQGSAEFSHQERSSTGPVSTDEPDTMPKAHPFQPIPSLRETPLALPGPEPARLHAPETRIHSKFGSYQFNSHGDTEVGESLLAKRLKGLDVHKHETRGLN